MVRTLLPVSWAEATRNANGRRSPFARSDLLLQAVAQALAAAGCREAGWSKTIALESHVSFTDHTRWPAEPGVDAGREAIMLLGLIVRTVEESPEGAVRLSRESATLGVARRIVDAGNGFVGPDQRLLAALRDLVWRIDTAKAVARANTGSQSGVGALELLETGDIAALIDEISGAAPSPSAPMPKGESDGG